ncbi:hypothetical protein BELL_1327g00020 [Botrytis elliptica]|uniref:Uncharacterized protein n=1 Tax=Botrytis elliptica TaxID=278938 RepID=A0A4Z1I875_9HELO|nr:hypothetical protein BELL_1327g00020 [Botrytis elliptica]
MIIEPVNRPPTPAPAIARPTISILLLLAVAQRKELRIDLLVRGSDSGSGDYLPKLKDGNGSQEGCNAAFTSAITHKYKP